MTLFEKLKISGGHESGIGLLDTLVTLAILGTIAVTFLSGLVTTSKATFIVDEQVTAESLAQSQMEWVRDASYIYGATQYSPAPIPGGKDYLNYSARVDAEALRDPDDGIQKISVVIKHSGSQAIRLETYKVDR